MTSVGLDNGVGRDLFPWKWDIAKATESRTGLAGLVTSCPLVASGQGELKVQN